MHNRSTSKIADRVAAATEHAEHGVLIEAALLMVNKAKEKKQQQAAEGKVAQPVHQCVSVGFRQQSVIL